MRIILSVFLLLFLVGCGFKDVEQKPQSYRLQSNLIVQKVQKKDPRVLLIQEIQGDSAVISKAILYLQNGALKPYKYSRWSEVPSTKIQQMIVEYLEAKELFKATIPSLSLAQSDLVLESDLNNFEQVFKEGNSYVHVKIRFRLVQRAEAKVLGTISFEEKITPKGESTQDVVEAFNVGINKIMQNLSIWISETI